LPIFYGSGVILAWFLKISGKILILFFELHNIGYEKMISFYIWHRFSLIFHIRKHMNRNHNKAKDQESWNIFCEFQTFLNPARWQCCSPIYRAVICCKALKYIHHVKFGRGWFCIHLYMEKFYKTSNQEHKSFFEINGWVTESHRALCTISSWH